MKSLRHRSASHANINSIPAIAAWIAAAVLGWIVVIPLPPWITSASSLDASWQWVLAWAFARGLQFGRDILFTYGPWGFTVSDLYYPGCLWWSVAFRLMLLAAVFCGIFTLVQWSSFPSIAGASLAALAILVGRADGLLDPLYYQLALLYVLLHVMAYDEDRGSPPTTPAVFCISFVMGAMSLTKFTFLLTYIAAMALTAVSDVLTRRKPWSSIVFAASMVLWWLAAGQHPLNYPAFLRYGIQISAVWEEMGTTSGDLSMFPVFLILSLTLVFVSNRCSPPSRKVPVVIIVLALCGMSFKYGFSRHDYGHEFTANRTLAIVALTLLPICFGRRREAIREGEGEDSLTNARQPRSLIIICLSCFLLALCASALSVVRLSESHSLAAISSDILAVFRERLAFIRSASASLELVDRRYKQAEAELRRDAALPHLKGTVDALTVNQAVLVASDRSGTIYRPRPGFQSYATASEILQKVNAEFFQSEAAPDYVLFSGTTIDGRLAAMEDSLVIPELIARYNPVVTVEPPKGPRYLVLERAHSAGTWQLQTIARQQTSWSEMISVPDAGEREGIWVEINIRPTFLGRVFAKLFRRPAVLMSLTGPSSISIETFRLIPSVAKQGFLLSPVIKGPSDLSKLSSKEFQDHPEYVACIFLRHAAAVILLRGRFESKTRELNFNFILKARYWQTPAVVIQLQLLWFILSIRFPSSRLAV